MKAFLITLFVIMSSTLLAQNYLNQTAVWNQLFTHNGPVTSQVSHIKYYITGDTVYQNKIYFKLYSQVITIITRKEMDSIGQPFFVTDTIRANTLAKILREDDKKFIILDTAGNESILYNFNLLKGDSITKAVEDYTCIGGNLITLVNSDTVCIGSISRKRWSLGVNLNISATNLIEGVGFNTGFLTPICKTGCPECSYSLTNFLLNGDTLYNGSCFNTVGTKIVESTEKAQIVQLANAIQVSLKGCFNLLMYNMSGEVVYSAKALNNNHQINYVGVLPSGVYTLILNNNKTNQVKRVLIP